MPCRDRHKMRMMMARMHYYFTLTGSSIRRRAFGFRQAMRTRGGISRLFASVSPPAVLTIRFLPFSIRCSPISPMRGNAHSDEGAAPRTLLPRIAIFRRCSFLPLSTIFLEIAADAEANFDGKGDFTSFHRLVTIAGHHSLAVLRRAGRAPAAIYYMTTLS